jgi:hypothetical protein
MKDITHLTIIDKKMRVDDYIEDVTSILSARITRTSDFVGVKYVPSEFDENYVIGFQLMNT